MNRLPIVVITGASSGIGRALAKEMARLLEKRVKSGVVPAFPWKLLLPFFGHLPERFTSHV